MNMGKTEITVPSQERGFVLVTSLILIGVITVLGAVGTYKAIIETKVSKYAGDSARAQAVAAAGLNQMFWYWVQSGITNPSCDPGTGIPEPGCAERVAIMNYVLGNTNTLPSSAPFVAGLHAESLAGLNSSPAVTNAGAADVDAFIRASSNVRVYGFTKTAGAVTGVTTLANNAWATGTQPQVAVWATSYDRMDPGNGQEYPYGEAKAECTGSNCMLVVYALGRDGESRTLMREFQARASLQLTGVSAMTNAANYGDWNEMCQETDPPTVYGNVKAWTDPPPNNSVIEVTQAPYLRDIHNPSSNPSGTAIQSNTDIGGGGKGFRKGTSSTTGVSFEFTPLLLYSGHGPAAADNEARARLASAAQDNADPYSNLPDPKLPHNLVQAPLLNTPDQLSYFPNGVSQLFELDAYRWAAEQFTCQHNANGVISGTAVSGRYCGKVEALRQAVDALWFFQYGIHAWAPVSGRMTLAEFEYNVNYGIPMFGMVRVMLPTVGNGTNFSCTVNGSTVTGQMHDFTHGTLTTDKNGGTGFYDGYASPGFQVDADGTLDGTARLVLYGSLMFDFFEDGNSNDVFDPASGERLLTPLEETNAYMKFEMPILINPSLPRDAAGGSTGLLQFPTAHAGSGLIPTGNAASFVNMAAPDGSGYFPASEGLIPMTDSDTRQHGLTGTMRLMTNAAGDGLVDLANSLAGGFSAAPGNSSAMFSNENSALEYYHRLFAAVASPTDDNAWPVSAFPASFTGSFAIGREDSTAGNNDGDRMHLLFPSGYMHGWKVALAALDLSAADWNSLLTDIYTDANGLWSKHQTAKDYGNANYPSGSPFNPTLDAGFNKAGDLEQNQNDYFLVGLDAPGWIANHDYYMGDMIKVVTGTPPNTVTYFYQAQVDGTSGASAPAWDGSPVTGDGTVDWGPVTTGYPMLSSAWRDIPAEMYVGGLLDMHAHSNINGIVYTPGPLEWEPGNSSYAGDSNHYSYINGAIITGFGGYLKNKKPDGRYVLVYAIEAVDNINTSNTQVVMQRFGRQLLR